MKNNNLFLVFILLIPFNFFAQEWVKSSVGFNYIFRGIEFPEEQNDIAYAAGESTTYQGDGIVIKTTDGGETWTEIWTGVDKGLEAISFPTLNTGYVAGWGAYFAKTSNGGVTWQEQTLGADVWFFRGVVFKDESNGVVTAQTNTGSAVYWTNNGGQTWYEGTGLAAVPYQVTYVSGNTYFLVTNGGHVQKSVDNGATWTTVYTGTPEHFVGIDFYDEMTGIITTDYDANGDNYAYKTTDGGNTWQPYLVAQAGAVLRDVAWLDADNLTIVGTPEVIFSSEDGGNTWPINNFTTSTFNEALYEVLYTNDGTGYIIGAQGVLFKKEPLLSVADFELDREISLYPNPVNEKLNLASNTFVNYANVYTTEGIEVLTVEINALNSQIDLSSLASGVYIIQVFTNTSSRNYKFIKN
ncbi:YCF48-related protein [Gaetbulibacter jejuensis]|uniref:Secreted protein (Por secretion system target) n=1 Tax=Gaetbulibacter jejuensis TaxID=584607 RepID=A0ABN1JGS8_9FLAO